MTNTTRIVTPVATAIAIALLTTACGGGGSETETAASAPAPTPTPTPTPTPGVAVDTTFPTGLAVGSPAQLSATTVTANLSRNVDSLRYAADFGRTFWSAIKEGNGWHLAELLATGIPVSKAYAAPAATPEIANAASTVQAVLNGSTSISLNNVLDFDALFASGTNANCYGPSLAYRSHENAAPATSNSGTLPGGDLGIWLEYQGATQPCIAAQLTQRIQGIKGQTQQGLMLIAAMNRTVATSSSLTMPAAGATTTLTTDFSSLLRGQPRFAAFVIGEATISRDATGNIYTYRLTLNNGLTGASAKSGEIIMAHTPGSSSASYSGVMQVSAFSLTNDVAMGCTDVRDSTTTMFQAANVSTLKYNRAATAVSFSSRAGNYCGHPTSFTSSAFGADVASYTSGSELDASVSISGGVRGSTKGWVGNFSRFAGDFNVDTVDGDFRYAWQAGPGDGNSRMLLLDTSYNTVTEVRTLRGYFGFGNAISSSNGNLLGMICNWAGPGNSHTTQNTFQSQTAQLSASATEFTIATGGSKITYAPTNNCTSTTTEYDVNVDNTVAVGEGAGTVNNLDVPSGTNTVEQEIESRGFTPPTLY